MGIFWKKAFLRIKRGIGYIKSNHGVTIVQLDYAKKIRVSLIIPTVNQVALVQQCLTSLITNTKLENNLYEIIVVDDGSSREQQNELKKVLAPFSVRLIINNKNYGFAVTVNKGAACSNGDYLCLVNNDIIISETSWLELMLQEIRKFKVGVVGARLLYPDGRIQHGGVYYLPEHKTFDHEYRFLPGHFTPASRTGEALGVTGALMLIDKNLWVKLGGMCEQFFIALEDVDFCLRSWEAGWRVIYCGAAVAVHYEGLTRGNNISNKDPFWLRKEIEGQHVFFKIWQKKLSLLKRIGRINQKNYSSKSISQEQALQWRTFIENHNPVNS